MKKIMERCMAMLLAIVLMLSVFPEAFYEGLIPAEAAETEEETISPEKAGVWTQQFRKFLLFHRFQVFLILRKFLLRRRPFLKLLR